MIGLHNPIFAGRIHPANIETIDANARFQTLREDYRHKTAAALTDLDKNVQDLEAKQATGKVLLAWH